MTISYAIGVAGALLVLVWTILLVRRGLLSEKYAVVWLIVSNLCFVLAIAPGLLGSATRLLGFSLPVNLLFVGGALVQLLVALQLSIDMGRRQVESQRLAEEMAIVKAQISLLSRDATRKERSST